MRSFKRPSSKRRFALLPATLIAALLASFCRLTSRIQMPCSVPVLETPEVLETPAMDPEKLFNGLFLILAGLCFVLKLLTRERAAAGAASDASAEGKPAADPSHLRLRFLAGFWLFKMADWLQGPYFYDVYSSKVISGVPVSTELVARLFLVGFGTTALTGAFMGRLVDSRGRKVGSLAFVASYSLGALSTYSDSLLLLYAGRFAAGVGTSLLFSAPEAWLVGEHQREGLTGQWLSDTFGMAYFGDSVVAITAGQLAGLAAASRGPTAPFGLSLAFLACGGAVVLACWRENAATEVAAPASSHGQDHRGAGIADAWRLALADPRILSVGAVQALFEGSMYIFVLQWAPAVMGGLPGQEVPFGKVFSCFMVMCMVGSTMFGPLTCRFRVEHVTGGMLALAAVALSAAAAWKDSLPCVLVGFLLFEACVGFYFPAIGTLRSKYLPDSHRGVLMGMFQLPLNALVVAVMLTIKSLGLRGSLACSTAALVLGVIAELPLCRARGLPDAAPA